MNNGHKLILGDCLDEMYYIEDNSISAIITDPPYPCIKRHYGYWNESDWFSMMQRVVHECKRILKPNGSAVFILQPNYEKLGQMRLWLWKFIIWCGENWNIVQDAYWWNHTTLPGGGTNRKIGLMRSSIKYMVWIGNPDCYRNQANILWEPSDCIKKDIGNIAEKRATKNYNSKFPSGNSVNKYKVNQACIERGGVTPMNLIALSNGDSKHSAGAYGHGGGTPEKLMRYWINYLTEEGDRLLDPFVGGGTTIIAGLKDNREVIGIEKDKFSHHIAQNRINDYILSRGETTMKLL